jgi:hypothetical protein
MIYDKVQFSFGTPIEFGYRILSDDGQFIKFTDLDGNDVEVGPCGYECVLPNPRPNWAT